MLTLQSKQCFTSTHPGFVNAEELVMIDKTNKCVAIGDAPKWSFGGAREDDSYTTSGPG